MKNLIISLTLCFLSVSVFCQEESKEETLLSGDVENGWNVGVSFKTGQLNGDIRNFFGGKFAWVINHKIALGAKFNGLVNNSEIEGLDNIKLEFNYGGFLFEYIIDSDKLVHVNIQSLFAYGGVRYDVIDYANDHEKINFKVDEVFVVEPSAFVFINVHKNIRIGLGGSYRFATGVEYEGLRNSDLSGVSGDLVIKFGKF